MLRSGFLTNKVSLSTIYRENKTHVCLISLYIEKDKGNAPKNTPYIP